MLDSIQDIEHFLEIIFFNSFCFFFVLEKYRFGLDRVCNQFDRLGLDVDVDERRDYRVNHMSDHCYLHLDRRYPLRKSCEFR